MNREDYDIFIGKILGEYKELNQKLKEQTEREINSFLLRKAEVYEEAFKSIVDYDEFFETLKNITTMVHMGV